MKKILLCIVVIISIILSTSFAFADESIDTEDVFWDWKVVKDNLYAYSGGNIIDDITEYIKTNDFIVEYIERCEITYRQFASEQYSKIVEYFEGLVKKDKNDREYISLQDVIEGLEPDIKSMIILDLLENRYSNLFHESGSKEIGSGELITKAVFSKLIEGKDNEQGMKESFALIYFIQKTICQNREFFVNAVENDPAQMDTLAGTDKSNWVYITKDGTIMKFLVENKIDISTAASFDSLSDDCFINTSDEYVGAYRYFFASSEKYQTYYDFDKSTEEAEDKWKEENILLKNWQVGIDEDIPTDSDYHVEIPYSILEYLRDAGDYMTQEYLYPNHLKSYKTEEQLATAIVKREIDFASFLNSPGKYTLLGYRKSGGIHSDIYSSNYVASMITSKMQENWELYRFKAAGSKYSVGIYFIFRSDMTPGTYELELKQGNNTKETCQILGTLFDSNTVFQVNFHTGAASVLAIRGTFSNGIFTIDDEAEDIYYFILTGHTDEYGYAISAYGRKPEDNTELGDKIEIKSLRIRTTISDKQRIYYKVEPHYFYSFNENVMKELEAYTAYEDIEKEENLAPKDCRIELRNESGVTTDITSTYLYPVEIPWIESMNDMAPAMNRYLNLAHISLSSLPSEEILYKILTGKYAATLDGLKDYWKNVNAHIEEQENSYSIKPIEGTRDVIFEFQFGKKDKTNLITLLRDSRGISKYFSPVLSCAGKKYLQIRGEYEHGELTIDVLGKEIYYIYMYDDGTCHILKPKINITTDGSGGKNSTIVVDVVSSEKIMPDSIKIRLRSGYIMLTRTEYNNNKDIFEALNIKLNTSLQAEFSNFLGQVNMDVATFKLMDETLAFIKNVDYSGATKVAVQSVKNPLISGINYEEELGFCPDSVDVSGVCREKDWWKCAWQFFDNGEAVDISTEALDDLQQMVFYIGNIIFIVITSILGVKYIWGSVESKASVKNSLFTLVVAALVFYGWNAITELFDIQEILTGSGAAVSYKNVAKQIYSIILYIINFLAIGGIIYIGIKYMLAGADGKAEMKVKLLPAVLGIIMVYGTIQFINFILSIAGVI